MFSSEINVVIRGMEDLPHFKEAVLEERGDLNSDLIEAETVACARGLQQRHPDLGAILLECSMLPPYAKAVQDETGLPVFDFLTMIDYCYAGTHRQALSGLLLRPGAAPVTPGRSPRPLRSGHPRGHRMLKSGFEAAQVSPRFRPHHAPSEVGFHGSLEGSCHRTIPSRPRYA